MVVKLKKCLTLCEHEKQKADKGSDFSKTNVYFNFDVTPVGLDAGGTNVRGFVELGMSEQGIACAGLRVKF